MQHQKNNSASTCGQHWCRPNYQHVFCSWARQLQQTRLARVEIQWNSNLKNILASRDKCKILQNSISELHHFLEGRSPFTHRMQNNPIRGEIPPRAPAIPQSSLNCGSPSRPSHISKPVFSLQLCLRSPRVDPTPLRLRFGWVINLLKRIFQSAGKCSSLWPLKYAFQQGCCCIWRRAVVLEPEDASFLVVDAREKISAHVKNWRYSYRPKYRKVQHFN